MGNKTKLGKKRTKAAKSQKRLQSEHRSSKEVAISILNDIMDNVEKVSFCKKLVIKLVDFATKNDLPSTSFQNLASTSNQVPTQKNKSPVPGTSYQICTSPANSSDDYNFFDAEFIEECSKIDAYKLDIEYEKTEKKLYGYRVVEIDYFLKRVLGIQTEHNKICTGTLEISGEKKEGLRNTFILKCNNCEKNIYVCNEDPNNKNILNKAAVWGTLAIGSTYSHLEEFLSVLDIPSPSSGLFYKLQGELHKVWKKSLWEMMEEAGKKEREAAINRGDIDQKTGMPYITVYLDGGWSKRSYGHSYNACSGAAVIIGKCTGKLLFLGVRNKYCCICARANNKGVPAKEHICFQNWKGSSSSMEQDIIVEGFKCSIEMHNLIYKKFIADGDSSVYAKIKENVPYGLEVQKVECLNHVLKNYGKSLYKIKNNTKTVPLAARKILTKSTIDYLVNSVQNAVYANNNDVRILKEDIVNTFNHVFGNHMDCKTYLCEKVGDISNDKTKDVKDSGLHHLINGAMNQIITKANMLLDKETNNKAELFMSILVRFNMGKRLNLIQRDSFQIRAHLAALRYNEGINWHTNPWKKEFKKSPGKTLKKFIEQKKTIQLKRKLREEERPKSSKKLKFEDSNKKHKENEKGSVDYGPNISENFLSDEEINSEVESLCKRLQVNFEERDEIAKKTVGQFNNQLYLTHKMHRLTASNFGAVIRRRDSTPCDALVKKILNISSNLSTPAIRYGKENEAIAISIYEEKLLKERKTVTIMPSGLYIDVKHGFLAASPDGIINSEEIIEVKCSLKVAQSGYSLKEAVEKKLINYLEIKDNKIQLKKNHDYYYQIMGQLAITKASICHFLVYTGGQNEIFCQKISKDDNFWENFMLPKLIRFYKKCVGPEIILGRRLKNLKCRDPPK